MMKKVFLLIPVIFLFPVCVAEASAPLPYYTEVKNIVIVVNDGLYGGGKSELKELKRASDNMPFLMEDIRKMALDYAAKGLKKELHKCINVVASEEKHFPKYSSGYENFIIRLNLGFNVWPGADQEDILMGIALDNLRPAKTAGSLYMFHGGAGLAVQSLKLNQDKNVTLTQLQTTIKRLVSAQLRPLNASNSCDK